MGVINATAVFFTVSITVSILGPLISGVYLFTRAGYPLRKVITNSLWMAAFAFLVGFFWLVLWLILDLPKGPLPATFPVVVFVFFYLVQRIFFKEKQHKYSTPDTSLNDDVEDQDRLLLAYGLAKSTAGYLDTIILAGSGKDREQRMKLTDIEKYAANIMMMVAANRIANYFHQNPSVVHLLTLGQFWKGIYDAEEIASLQNAMIDEFNRLLVSDKDVLENIGDIFWQLGQTHDVKLVEKLGGIYRMWVDELSTGTTAE